MIEFKDMRETGTTPLEQAQIVMLRLLQVTHDICTRHSIPYWLDGGSLLGAVLYKGFIPWDDDIDIGMLRKDWYKFITIARVELPEDIFLQIRPDDFDYDQPFMKLRDKYSSILEFCEKGDEKYHKGIFIDIFPYDCFPSNPKIQYFLEYLFKFLFYSENNLTTLRKHKVGISGLFKKLVWRTSKIIPVQFKVGLLSWVGGISKQGKHPHVTSYVGLWNYQFLPLEYIFPLIEMEFCQLKFLVPSSYHEYLSKVFGDYHIPPSEDKQFQHALWIKPFHKCNHYETLNWHER